MLMGQCSHLIDMFHRIDKIEHTLDLETFDQLHFTTGDALGIMKGLTL